jgi:hypothetical protein
MPTSPSHTPRAIIDWLLQPEDPAVRYLTLTRLLRRSERNPEVRKARREIMETGVVAEILERQEPEGCWGRPDSFYTGKYKSTVWQLIVLAEHQADGRDQRVSRACEFILASSQDRGTGGFSQRRAKRTGGGLPREVIPCLTGNLVWSLLRLGRGDDERVWRGIEWLTRFLRFDDGESAPPVGWPYAHWEMCYGRHACFMGVAKGLKALAAVPEERRSAAVRDTIHACSEFLLRHHVYRRSHDLARVAKPGFTRFGFPRMYQTDALEIARLLVDLGCTDPRLQDALALIASRRQPDGRWLLQDTFNGSFLVDVERKGEPSKWITLNALRVLQAGGRQASPREGGIPAR